ncbi:uncharacterized protein VTP21DRAFT_3854 [Calcarisporiella thermophila]|uniref:uncharacterized protein n=1 Tax=Calcarisporiella thermophila TaxID=911321 RepID=UPI00374404E8
MAPAQKEASEAGELSLVTEPSIIGHTKDSVSKPGEVSEEMGKENGLEVPTSESDGSTVAENEVNRVEKTKDAKEEGETSPDANVPPPDSPLGCLVVVATWLVNFYCLAVCSYTFGVYQERYLTEVFPNRYSSLQVSFVGSLSTTLLLAFGPFVNPIIRLCGSYRISIMAGCLICVVGLILSSFATELWQIFLTQGFLLGFGSSLAFYSSITLPAEWFEKRRGFATGIALSGGGLGGLALNPLIRVVIDKAGYRWSLRVLALIGFVFLSVAALLARPRIKQRRFNNRKIIDFSVINRHLTILLGCGFFISFGYMAPFFYLNSFALHIGVEPTLAATLTGIMSGTNSCFRILLGFVSDYFGRLNTLLWCTLFAGLVTMIIWPLSNSLGVLIIFVILYGGLGGAYVSLYPVVISDLVPPEDLNNALALVYSISIFGYLCGPPLAGILLDMTGRENFVPLAEFAGGCTVAASLFLFALRFVLSRNLLKKI